MKRRIALRTGLVLIVCALAAPAAAQQPAVLLQRAVMIEREVDQGYGGMLRLVAGPHGGVQISAWREQKIRVEARVELNAPTERDLDTLATAVAVLVDPTPTAVDVTTRGPHDKKWMKGIKKFPEALTRMPWRVDYVVWVPEHTSLDLAVNDGETVVDGIQGIIGATSLNGTVRLRDTSGATKISSLVGDVEISTHDRAWRGGNLTVIAAGGDIRLLVPERFSAALTAAAERGVTIASGEGERALGPEVKERLGTGGAAISLTASGAIRIVVGEPADATRQRAEPE